MGCEDIYLSCRTDGPVVPVVDPAACACRPAIEKLLRQVPPKHTRQNVMFSATYPQNIKELASIALRPQYELVDTVGLEETHAAEMVRS